MSHKQGVFMKIGKSVLGDYKLGTEKEYLITNGLGSFSNGSINGNHARQYHGLFISSDIPPLDRYMLVHKVEEELNGSSLATSKEIFAGKTEIKEGYRYLDSFEYHNFLNWTYYKDGTFLEKEQFMVFEREILGIKYRIKNSVKDKNHVKSNFFMNYRDIHKMLKLHEHYTYSLELNKNSLKITIKEIEKEFYIISNGDIRIIQDSKIKEYNFQGDLIKSFERENLAYDIELGERGDKTLDSSKNLFYIEKELTKYEDLWVLVVNEDIENKTYDFDELYQNELKRVNRLKDNVSPDDQFLRDLAVAADTFIVKRQSTGEKTILAGYPWFGDWGRDTMIALTGLTLSNNRFDDAKSILKTFSKYVNQGMLPNKFPDYDGEELMYNTIDASLWYFYAVYNYLKYSNDYEFVEKNILDSLEEILEFHIKGTRYGIKVDEKDGLLKGGDEKTQLTWMDVKYKGVAITPRYGKTVEINALWYNALKVYENICKRLDKSYPSVYKELSEKIEKNYLETFWNEKENYLFDYISEKRKDTDLRPNQIFAVSLPYSLLDEEKSRLVVNTVFEKLYTTKGLRSLEKNNSKYIGRYFGNLCDRDSCYHQGTVWSWPLGHFLEAHYKVYKDKKAIATMMEGIKDHFYNEGAINNISEIFDGNEPHKERGCFAQAWSVGEILRVYKEILK